MPIDVQEECISKLVGRQAQIIEQSLVDARRLPHLPLGTVLFSFKAFKWLLSHHKTVEYVKTTTQYNRPHLDHIPLLEGTRRQATSY